MAGVTKQLEPQNIDAERALLGAVFMDPDCIFDVQEICQPDDFFRPEHRNIFAAMCDLAQKSLPVDILTVHCNFRRLKVLLRIYEINSHSIDRVI